MQLPESRVLVESLLLEGRGALAVVTTRTLRVVEALSSDLSSLGFMTVDLGESESPFRDDPSLPRRRLLVGLPLLSEELRRQRLVALNRARDRIGVQGLQVVLWMIEEDWATFSTLAPDLASRVQEVVAWEERSPRPLEPAEILCPLGAAPRGTVGADAEAMRWLQNMLAAPGGRALAPGSWQPGHARAVLDALAGEGRGPLAWVWTERMDPTRAARWAREVDGLRAAVCWGREPSSDWPSEVAVLLGGVAVEDAPRSYRRVPPPPVDPPPALSAPTASVQLPPGRMEILPLSEQQAPMGPLAVFSGGETSWTRLGGPSLRAPISRLDEVNSDTPLPQGSPSELLVEIDAREASARPTLRIAAEGSDAAIGVLEPLAVEEALGSLRKLSGEAGTESRAESAASELAERLWSATLALAPRQVDLWREKGGQRIALSVLGDVPEAERLRVVPWELLTLARRAPEDAVLVRRGPMRALRRRRSGGPSLLFLARPPEPSAMEVSPWLLAGELGLTSPRLDLVVSVDGTLEALATELARAERDGDAFEVIVLDVPGFYDDRGALVELAFEVDTPGGRQLRRVDGPALAWALRGVRAPLIVLAAWPAGVPSASGLRPVGEVLLEGGVAAVLSPQGPAGPAGLFLFLTGYCRGLVEGLSAEHALAAGGRALSARQEEIARAGMRVGPRGGAQIRFDSAWDAPTPRVRVASGAPAVEPKTFNRTDHALFGREWEGLDAVRALQTAGCLLVSGVFGQGKSALAMLVGEIWCRLLHPGAPFVWRQLSAGEDLVGCLAAAPEGALVVLDGQRGPVPEAVAAALAERARSRGQVVILTGSVGAGGLAGWPEIRVSELAAEDAWELARGLLERGVSPTEAARLAERIAGLSGHAHMVELFARALALRHGAADDAVADDVGGALAATLAPALQGLDARTRARIHALAPVRGVVDVGTLAGLLDASVEEAVGFGDALVAAGLADAEGPYLLPHPGLLSVAEAEVDPPRRARLELAWLRGVVALAGRLGAAQAGDARETARGLALAGEEILAALRFGVERADRTVETSTAVLVLITDLLNVTLVQGHPALREGLSTLREQVLARGLVSPWGRLKAELQRLNGALHQGRFTGLAEQAAAAVRQARELSEVDCPRLERELLVWNLSLQQVRALAIEGTAPDARRALERAWRRLSRVSGLAPQPRDRVEGTFHLERAQLLGRDGHLAEADQSFREAETIFERLGDRRSLAVARGSHATLWLAHGRPDRVLGPLRAARQDFEEMGDQAGIALAELRLGMAFHATGQLAEAERSLIRALAIFREREMRHGVADVLAELGRLMLSAGRLDEAEARLLDAHEEYGLAGFSGSQSTQRHNLAATLLQKGLLDRARIAALGALELSRASQGGDQPWLTSALLADIERAAQRHDEARRWWREARGIYLDYRRSGGAPRDAEAGALAEVLARAEPARSRSANQLRAALTRAGNLAHPLMLVLDAVLTGADLGQLAEDPAIPALLAAEIGLALGG